MPVRAYFIWITAGVLASSLASGVDAQLREPAQATWEFRSVPQADLWFHSLAVVGYEGFAPLPLYNAEYAAAIRAAKEAAGVYPTQLDTMAGSLRAGFSRDSTFEVLHFMPLYFGTAEPEAVVAALRGVTERRSGGTKSTAQTAFGAGVAAALFRSRAQRQLLGRYVRALEEEWQIFYRAHWLGSADDRTRRREAAQRVWEHSLARNLQPFLRRAGLAEGLILVSPALGPEGRIFRGDPGNPTDNVLAVWLPPEPVEVEVSAFAAVRELCYPFVSGLVAESGIATEDRYLGERISSRGAVRCGALLLERFAPALRDSYERAFVRAAGDRAAADGAFEHTYPLDDHLLESLRQELRQR